MHSLNTAHYESHLLVFYKFRYSLKLIISILKFMAVDGKDKSELKVMKY